MSRADGPPRFVCDEMLGQLAKWLRILGYDATYLKDVEDDEVLQAAREQDRVLLTRDRRLRRRATAAGIDAHGVAALDPDAQLDEVVAALDLDVTERRLLSRCTVCNVAVEEVLLEEVLDEVPEAARDHDAYWRCPECDRVYWEGTHVKAIRERVQNLE